MDMHMFEWNAPSEFILQEFYFEVLYYFVHRIGGSVSLLAMCHEWKVKPDHSEYSQVTILKSLPETNLSVIDVWTIKRPFGVLKSNGKFSQIIYRSTPVKPHPH